MKEIQFVLNGGLGNQIFQYLASKYISDKFKYLNINYSLSDWITNSETGFGFNLNQLLKDPIKISSEYNNKIGRLFAKITKKSFERTLFISDLQKYQLQLAINFKLNLFKENNTNLIFKNNSLNILFDNLETYFINKFKLQVHGYLQNPSNYINEIDKYKKLFKNNYYSFPSHLKPNTYISIHLRRGDYLSNKQILDHYFSKFSPVEFILLSLKLIPNQFSNYPIYFISDDLNWRNKMIEILSNRISNKFILIDKTDALTEWSILRRATINICSNSTFSYTAALLNPENINQKLRCIIPQWINQNETAFEKGWLSPKGFIDI